MKSVKIKVYSDPGHSWGAVKRNLLQDLGLSDRITAFSFQRGQTVYLEEDCDLPTLVTALSMINVTPIFEFHHIDRSSPIRSYNRFSI